MERYYETDEFKEGYYPHGTYGGYRDYGHPIHRCYAETFGF